MSEDMQAQLEEQKKNCIFCKIVNKETESKIVYEDDLTICTMDINPWTLGHTLVMPKEHYPILPLLPEETFDHIFGILPKLVGSINKATVSTGSNIFIANGGVAGQQSPHFLFHIIPRDSGDNNFIYSFDKKGNIEKEKQEEATKVLKNNIPIMIRNNLTISEENISKEEKKEDTSEDKQKTNDEVFYKDGKLEISFPENTQCIGHMKISGLNENNIEDLSYEDSIYIFRVASICASAVFEGVGSQGTNIIVKSGNSDDNFDKDLSIHILPRFQEDGLDVLMKPIENKPDLDEISSKIKSETLLVNEYIKEREKKIKEELEKLKPKVSDDIKKEIDNAILSIQKNT